MNPTDKAQFVALLRAVAEFYRDTLSPVRLELYWRSLQRYSLAELQRALNAHLIHPDQGMFMPKPADIVRILQGSLIDQAQSAWAKVHKALYQVGSYDSVAFDDALIHSVIDDLGGWVLLCRSPAVSLVGMMKSFVQRYRYYAAHPPVAYPPHLPGLIELSRAASHSPLPSPTLVGNPVKAQHVLEAGEHYPGELSNPLAIGQDDDMPIITQE